MNKSHYVHLIRTAGFATAITLLLLVAGSYWGWSASNRPSFISGVWLLDDLRTEGDDASIVAFSPNGIFDDGEKQFGCRWRHKDGQLFFRTWKTSENSLVGRSLQNSTFYSWFAKSNEFSLRVEFSEGGNVMTLTPDGEGPRCRLRRAVR